jgi:hypothetical protein
MSGTTWSSRSSPSTASTQDIASLVTSNAASVKSVGTSTRRIMAPFIKNAYHGSVNIVVSRVQGSDRLSPPATPITQCSCRVSRPARGKMVISERVCLDSSHDECSGKRLRSSGKGTCRRRPMLDDNVKRLGPAAAQCRLCIALLLSNSYASTQVYIFIEEFQNNFVASRVCCDI